MHLKLSLIPDGFGRFETKPVDVRLGIVAAEGGEIDAGHGSAQPGCLPFHLKILRVLFVMVIV